MSLNQRSEFKPVPRGNQGPTKIDAYGWTLVDEQGVQFPINKLELHVDHGYQRQLSSERVSKIRAAWSWIACGVLVVGERDQTYFVIDGQHRLMAALSRADIKELPCIVFKLASRAAEARGFSAINVGRKPPTVIEQFTAQVVGEDQVATRMQELLSNTGYRAGRSGVPYTISCLTTALREFQTNPTMFERVWPAIVIVHNGAQINQRVLAGLFWIERNAVASLTESRWLNRLVSIGPARLEDVAKRASLVADKGGARVWGTAILSEINKSLRLKLELRPKE